MTELPHISVDKSEHICKPSLPEVELVEMNQSHGDLLICLPRFIRFRKRRDSEEENIYLDLNRATSEIIQEILFNVVNQDVNISRKLGYLNGLVKLCMKQQREFGISYKDIFCCPNFNFWFLDLLTFHLTIGLKSAGFETNEKSIGLNPNGFPRAFSSCLVAIANEGSQERDMIRPCLATLAQLALLNPHACIEAKGVNALLKNVVENAQCLLAPFTDCHYRFPTSVDGSASEDKDPNLNSSKAAIVCALLSWPGLFYLCQSNSPHLQSLIEMLYLPYPDLRKNILDLLYKIFDLSIPEWTDDFTAALSSSDPSSQKYLGNFMRVILLQKDLIFYHIHQKTDWNHASSLTNLVYNYYALLVLVFVNCGLLEALSSNCNQ
ncbi:rapamycin-insensitive companion of mTOR [Caerostris extrusa]|uniref:Rapamycin-insensitive companion of mTOR n=1 Tax=Caerostris extrusa TaxID=172846 RepID=A0AAV4N5H4_CAEEX|nr:rapamycin-insensitive companion of mTOR [Caerostris extrusa]